MKKNKEVLATSIWNEEKAADLKEFIGQHSQKQTARRKLKNELLAIKYRIEDYIENDDSNQKIMISDFVKMYLNALNVTQKSLAMLFEMQDSNLHKYLTGERRLSADMVLKLSEFSHIDPEYWLRVEIKNELFELKKEKKKLKEYKKYDYRNLLQ
ncbi:helix-turn-helix transcriptional regulator [Taibaiella soli]|uniref:Transcriptional regulator n=1 Tax=Taibaiella soli TaxID=1649169 RepID=A0A2W2B5S0_9BACT|nr:helix-turn-helix domain-containing protein [Taibaiella soli]PZF71327.1 transcriptional regulator [Taibaiella soli]